MPRADADAGTTTRHDHRRDYPVAFFGDSLMWGQGLAREHRFAELTADALARDAGKNRVIVHDWSRSGAQINATRDDRVEFTETFPELFNGAGEAAAFRGGDEAGARALYGENPGTFPTVTWQVEHLDPALGRTVKLALVCGGGNDMGLETLFDPDTFDNDFVTQWEGLIQKIAFEYVCALLEQVRAKCPNAVILYYGYHSPFSHESSHAKMRAFAKYLNDNDLTWGLNEVLHIKPTNSILEEIRCRSVWASARALYWQKQAITRINQDSDLRGPGVLFVPSGYEPRNSTFAPEPLVWGDYSNPTNDEMQAKRVDSIPRRDQQKYISTCSLAGLTDIHGQHQVGLNEFIEAEKGLTGPLPLLRSLRRLIELLRAGASEEELRWVRFDVAMGGGREAARMDRARIASFLHPNVAGARRFADMALRRFGDERNRVAQLAAERAAGGPAPGPGGVIAGPGRDETIDEALRRYGLRGRSPLVESDLGQLDVDSLGIWAVTARNSDKDMATDAYLMVDTGEAGQQRQRRYRLNMPWATLVPPIGPQRVLVKKQYPEFEPGMTTRMTVDPGAPLLLRDIRRVWLQLGPDRNTDALQGHQGAAPAGSVWRPRRLFLLVNGVLVTDQTFRSLELKPGDTHSFGYPPRRAPVVVGAAGAGNG